MQENQLHKVNLATEANKKKNIKIMPLDQIIHKVIEDYVKKYFWKILYENRKRIKNKTDFIPTNNQNDGNVNLSDEKYENWERERRKKGRFFCVHIFHKFVRTFSKMDPISNSSFFVSCENQRKRRKMQNISRKIVWKRNVKLKRWIWKCRRLQKIFISQMEMLQWKVVGSNYGSKIRTVSQLNIKVEEIHSWKSKQLTKWKKTNLNQPNFRTYNNKRTKKWKIKH